MDFNHAVEKYHQALEEFIKGRPELVLDSCLSETMSASLIPSIPLFVGGRTLSKLISAQRRIYGMASPCILRA